jgi:23S rRNA-/tRNA-specific pseudouridylate synthase
MRCSLLLLLLLLLCRLRMMAVPYGSGRGRTAASNYQTLQQLAGGGAALVQWKLETGRTHQIRWAAAAKYFC